VDVVQRALVAAEQDLFLVREVVVEAALGALERPADVLHRGPGVALVTEGAEGDVEDLVLAGLVTRGPDDSRRVRELLVHDRRSVVWSMLGLSAPGRARLTNYLDAFDRSFNI